MIRKDYRRSVMALLLIPVVVMLGGGIFAAIDPELARGHAQYARNFALLAHLRNGVWLAALVLACALWLLACVWLVRAKSRHRAWLSLALLGPPGFAVLAALSDRSPSAPGHAHGGQPERPPRLLRILYRILYEVLRFAVLGFVTLQLVEWADYGTAILEATRRGVALADVLAERDASSGMWAFGDMMWAACLLVLIYALWPAGCSLVARMIRRR